MLYDDERTIGRAGGHGSQHCLARKRREGSGRPASKCGQKNEHDEMLCGGAGVTRAVDHGDAGHTSSESTETSMCNKTT